MGSANLAQTQTISDFKISGTTLTLTSLYSYLDSAGFSSGTITVSYAPSLISLPSATVTITPLNLSVSVTNLAIKSTGVSFDNATLSATSVGSIGGLIGVTDPKLTFSNIAYTTTGNVLTGSVSLTATGANLSFGGSISASITHDPTAAQVTVLDTFSVSSGSSTKTVILT